MEENVTMEGLNPSIFICDMIHKIKLSIKYQVLRYRVNKRLVELTERENRIFAFAKQKLRKSKYIGILEDKIQVKDEDFTMILEQGRLFAIDNNSVLDTKISRDLEILIMVYAGRVDRRHNSILEKKHDSHIEKLIESFE